MKKNILFALVALVICSGIYIIFKQDFDRYNPLYKQEYVYVIINKPAKPERQNARFRYNLSGYTEQGQKKKITFSASKELDQNTYVRVLAKGAYTQEWIFIKKEDVPNKALQ
jgi:uncharacterized protein (TIGR01655 family)